MTGRAIVGGGDCVLLFVYGTLLFEAKGEPGLHQRALLAREAEALGTATTQGALIDHGDYPGLIDGAGLVHGALYRLTTPRTTLAWLDAYEGITEAGDGEYERRLIACRTANGDAVTAWAYFWLRPTSNAKRIASGRWLAYMQNGH